MSCWRFGNELWEVSCWGGGTTEEATEEAEEEEDEEEEPGVSEQKQKPHTKMWGKIQNLAPPN